MAITLYQFEISPFCDKIRRVLAFKGLDYTIREVGLLEASRLKAISPLGKYPALDYHGRVVFDSTDIAHYLEERHPAPALIPKDPKSAGLCHIFEDWADESLYFYEMTMRLAWPNNAKRWIPELVKQEKGFTKALASRMTPGVVTRHARAQGIGRKRRENILMEVERHYRAVDGWVEGQDFLCGPELTLGDIAVFAQLACIRGTEEGGPLFQRFPSLVRWFDRVDGLTGRRPRTKSA